MTIKEIMDVYRIFDNKVLRYLAGISNISDEQDYLNKKSALEQICPPEELDEARACLDSIPWDCYKHDKK